MARNKVKVAKKVRKGKLVKHLAGFAKSKSGKGSGVVVFVLTAAAARKLGVLPQPVNTALDGAVVAGKNVAKSTAKKTAQVVKKKPSAPRKGAQARS